MATACEAKNCGSCTKEGCAERQKPAHEETHPLNNIKRVIGIVSGKGGVGKSLVTSLLAVSMNRKGHSVGILDADLTGPSIAKMFGIDEKITGTEDGSMYPQLTDENIEIMSVNLLLKNPDDPVIWRGPILAGVVKDFWSKVIWGELDYLFIDMPPGTGDVPLTVFQSIPLDGVIIVTSPQDLVSMIVKKAYNMAKMMNIPILGIVENMSYIKCPDCGKEIKLFGESHVTETAKELGVSFLGRIAIDPELAELADQGQFEKMTNNSLALAVDKIEEA